MNGRSLILLAATGAAFAAGGAAVGATTEPAAVPPIVYAAGGTGTERLGAELYVREADGTTRRLTRNRVFDGFPRWSPDRSKIVFVRARGSDSDLYIKNAHAKAIPAVRAYAAEFTKESAFGPNGYLRRSGLIASPGGARAKSQQAARGLAPMNLASLK